MRFYQITIGAIDISDCKAEVDGLEELQVNVTGNSTVAAAGNRIRQPIEWTSGKEFSIKIAQLSADVYSDLKTLLNTANETGASFTVAGTGASGNFSVTAKPLLQKPFAAGKFIENKIQDVVLRFET